MVITIGSLFSLLITLLILGVVVWLVNYIIDNIPVANPFGRVVKVVVMVVCSLAAIIVLLQFAGLMSGDALVLRP